MTLTELCRAIAAKDAEWEKHGVRVVDPETGVAWRYAPNCVTGQRWSPEVSDPLAFFSMSRAIDAGPDPEDAATLGVLLGLMPDHGISKWGDAWVCRVGSTLRYEHEWSTRAEAILRAYAASRGIA